MFLQITTLPILLSDGVLKLFAEAESDRTECSDIFRQVHSLSSMLRSVVRLTSTASALTSPNTIEQTLSLIRRCKHHHNLPRHLFLTITSSATDFCKISSLLDSSITDLTWLLSLHDDNNSDSDDGANLSIPLIANTDPILAWV